MSDERDDRIDYERPRIIENRSVDPDDLLDGCAGDFTRDPTPDEDIDGILLFADVDALMRDAAAHPEAVCGRCGRPNFSWVVDSDRFNLAVDRSEIVCPVCFVAAHEAATGLTCSWQLAPATPFRRL